MLAGCIALFVLSASAPVLWWKRRNAGKLATPPSPRDPAKGRNATVAAILLGTLFPLTGASMILIWVVDQFVVARERRLVRLGTAPFAVAG